MGEWLKWSHGSYGPEQRDALVTAVFHGKYDFGLYVIWSPNII